MKNRILQEKYEKKIADIIQRMEARADIKILSGKMFSRIEEIFADLPEAEDVPIKVVKVYDFLNKNRNRPPKSLGGKPSTKRYSSKS